MQLRYNFRIYPSKAARMALTKSFGCARVVYNDAVEARQKAYLEGRPSPSSAALQQDLITRAKKTPERVWLAEVSHTMLQQAIRDCDAAYRRFYASLAGKGQGPRSGRPKFKSRRSTRQSIRFTAQDFRILADNRLHLTRVGPVEVRWSRTLPAKPSSVTIVRDSAGRYFASFVVNVDTSPLPPADAEIGLDLGLTSYAVDSSGCTIANPRFLRMHERRLRRAQKSLSRKQIGSANRLKARHRLARKHAKVTDCRRDWLHKATTRLIRENQAIYLEDLAVAAIGKTRLAKSVFDASWGTFRYLLASKAARYGRHLGVINRFAPTSQICSTCGERSGRKPLGVRRWVCHSCGTSHDRDENAAINILALGRRERLNACGAQVSPGESLAQRGEAGTGLSCACAAQQEGRQHASRAHR